MTDILDRLETTIAERLSQGSAQESHVARLAARGRLKIAEKLGEEAIETVIAAIAQNDDALVAEAADLLFHLLIVLGERGIRLAQVKAELERREGLSGLDEKARRV